jgi:hypothetical protein
MLLRTLVNAAWPSVTPSEAEFYGFKPIHYSGKLTNLQLRPKEPVTLLYALELVLLADGYSRNIAVPRKKISIPRTMVTQSLLQLLRRLDSGKWESMFQDAVGEITNAPIFKQPPHVQCIVENFAMAAFGIHWYTTASLRALFLVALGNARLS